jgi:hypothetical protein
VWGEVGVREIALSWILYKTPSLNLDDILGLFPL